MKKFFVIAIAVLVFLPVGLYAGSIGGVTTQGQGVFGAGIALDWTFDRDLELDSIDLGLAVEDPDARDHYNIPVSLSYGITNEIDIYAMVGYNHFRNEGTLPIGNFTIETDNSPSYGLGAKASFASPNNFIYGIDVKYVWGKNDNDIVVIGSGALTDKGEVDFKQWHIAPYVAKEMQDTTAYIGLRYSDAVYENEFDTIGSIDFKTKENIGLFAGFDYEVNQTATVNVEARYFDEAAITVGVVNKF